MKYYLAIIFLLLSSINRNLYRIRTAKCFYTNLVKCSLQVKIFCISSLFDFPSLTELMTKVQHLHTLKNLFCNKKFIYLIFNIAFFHATLQALKINFYCHIQFFLKKFRRSNSNKE